MVGLGGRDPDYTSAAEGLRIPLQLREKGSEQIVCSNT